MDVAYLVSLLLFSLMAREAKAAIPAHVTVYCHNAMVRKDSNVPPEVCRDACFKKVNSCKKLTNVTYDHKHHDGIEVKTACFNAEDSHSKDCIFPKDQEVRPKMPFTSGVVVAITDEDVVVNFPPKRRPLGAVKYDEQVITNFSYANKTVVFAQVIPAQGAETRGKVRIREITDSSFTFRVESKPGIVHSVAWFAIEEDDALKKFGPYHVHLDRLSVSRTHTLIISNAQYVHRSDNIAMFVQELTPQFDARVEMKITEEDVQVYISTTKIRTSIPFYSADVNEIAILLVDMDHFKNERYIKFGTMPVSFLLPERRGHEIVVPVSSQVRPLLFYTPYYRRVGGQVPSAACSWNYQSETHGQFMCDFAHPSLITLPPDGPSNVAFLVIPRIDTAIDAHLMWFKYGVCSMAHSTLPYDYQEDSDVKAEKEASPLDPDIEELESDTKCKKLCVIRNKICKGDLNCIQAYLGNSCTITGATTTPKRKEEAAPALPNYLDPLVVLGEELKGAVCTGLHFASNAKEVEEKRSQWLHEAETICKSTGSHSEKNVMMIIDGFVSMDFCKEIGKRGTAIKWTPLKEFRDTYMKGNSTAMLKTVFSNFRVYGLCHYHDEVEILRYQELVTLNAEDTEQSLDCIETEWEEWGVCSGDCIPDTGQVLRKRNRSVLRPPVGDGRKCVTEETRPCTLDDLPMCSSMCIVTEWSEWSRCVKSTRFRQRYVRVYSRHCDNMKMLEKERCESIDDDDDEEDEENDGDVEDESVEAPDERIADGNNDEHNSGDGWRQDPVSIEEYMAGDMDGYGHGMYNGGYEMDQENPEYMNGYEDRYDYHNGYSWDQDWRPEDRDSAYRSEEMADEGGMRNTDETVEKSVAEENYHSRPVQSVPEEKEGAAPEKQSFLEMGDVKEARDCAIWSEWSGCSSVCDDEPGHQYRISSVSDPNNIYDVCSHIGSRPCSHTEECGLNKKVNCDEIKSAYHSEDGDSACRVECNMILERCKEESQENEMECFTRLREKVYESGEFVFRCLLPEEYKERLDMLHSIFKNKCFLSRAVYSDTKKSWVNHDTQSCYCSIPGSVPCTSKHIHYNREEIYADLVDSGFCPTGDYMASFFVPGEAGGKPDSLTYVSLAGKQRLHCPLAMKNHDVYTYTDFGDEKLEHYCQHGPLYAHKMANSKSPVRQYEHKYNCDTAESTGSISGAECKLLCRSVRMLCMSKHESYMKCIKERLFTNSEYEAQLFEKYGCRLPPTLDLSFDEDYYREFITTFETDTMSKKPCAILVHNAIMHCEAHDMLNNRDSFAHCMESVIEDTAVNPVKILLGRLFQDVESSVTKFKNNCRFNPALKAGSGYVMCRFPAEIENYESWSNWSECTADCNDFDEVATRYRTREVAKHAQNKFFPGGMGTLQFDLCLHLKGCQRGRWVDSLNESDTKIHILNYKAYMQNRHDEMTEWLDHTYNRYPELRNEVSTRATCQIFTSVKTISYKGITCGCPKNHPPCSFATAISSPKWIEGMENFCRDRPLASIGFQGEISNYRYYCNIGMLLTPAEYTSTPACDYYDNNEYVACQSIDHEPITLRTKHFTFMGICLGLLFSMYAMLRRVISRRRSRTDAVSKED